MTEDRGEIPYPADSDLYKPTGDFNTDAEKLAKVMEPFKRQAARREEEAIIKAEQQAEAVAKVKQSLNEAWTELPSHESVSVPQPDGSFIVVRKSEDRIRIARSSDANVSMGGYHPNFAPMSGFEVVTYNRSKGQPETIHMFNINKLKAGDTARYWGDARRIHLEEGRSSGSYASTDEVTSIPETAPLTNSIPEVLDFVRSQASQ